MRPEDDPERLVLTEEHVSVEKRPFVSGRVRVRSETHTAESFARAELDGEVVEVTRVPVDRPVDEAPAIRTEGDLTIFPVMEEVLVLEKRLYLKEEIHVRRQRITEHVEIPVTLRQQRAVVERIDPEAGEIETQSLSTVEAKSNE
jgi:uncharacterized protein (TIGR02271 family)